MQRDAGLGATIKRRGSDEYCHPARPCGDPSGVAGTRFARRARRDQRIAAVKRLLAAYAGTLVIMVALDLLWLGVIAKPLYQQGIGHLMADKPLVPVAVLFYALFALGLVVFAVAPAGPAPGWGRTAATAALFGFFAYATYDLTNLATLKHWPVGLSLLDIAWGTGVSAAAAVGGKALMDWTAGS